jgi:hypothetical protein
MESLPEGRIVAGTVLTDSRGGSRYMTLTIDLHFAQLFYGRL